jgi:hypothetical protein
MSLFKAFFTKHTYAATAAHPTGQEAVALFFYGAAPDVATITALAPDAKIAVNNAGGKTRITVSWDDVSTVITIDPSWNKTEQMQGMRGWTERFPARVRALDEVKALIASFDNVCACYGTVSKPGLDADHKVFTLLRAMGGSAGGFLFSRNSFYDMAGLRITGVDEDKPWLGAPPSVAE